MRHSRVKTLLLLTIFVVAIAPLAAAFYFLNRALQTSLDLGFSEPVMQALNVSSQNLKTLKRLDPAGQERYREQFAAAESLKRVYSNPQWVKAEILGSLRIYFGIGLVATVLLSVLLALLLSRRIARTYKLTFDELLHHRQRTRYLEEMASWQGLARMLAHEIKNPLTPIEVLVTSLSKAYASKTEAEFRSQLDQTQAMIAEELSYLKATVSKFSEFARMPAVHLVEEDLPAVLTQLFKPIAVNFETARIRLPDVAPTPRLRVRIDATLFRQVLANIIRNGVEANPGRPVQFMIRLIARTRSIEICISNDGQPVPAEIADRIFDPYVSSKSTKDNMGLGLAIVKKIIFEHGGDVMYREEAGEPVFMISLPRVG